MKITCDFFVLTLFCLSIVACSRSEAPDTIEVDQNIATEGESPFLAKDEIPAAEIVSTDNDTEFVLTLKNRHGLKKEVEISGNPGYEPSIGEKTYILACGNRMLLIVIEQEIKTAVAFGSFFYNTLLDPKNGEWVTTFNGYKVGDKDTGAIISDDQKAILAKLKAGITQHCPQILDPNNDKAVEQLLQ